jgi:hypothetical protein
VSQDAAPQQYPRQYLYPRVTGSGTARWDTAHPFRARRRAEEFRMRRPLSRAALAVGAALAVVVAGSSGVAAAHGDPAPGTPEYLARDAQNIADAYGRQTIRTARTGTAPAAR